MAQKPEKPRSPLIEVIVCAEGTTFWIKRLRFEPPLCYPPAKGKQWNLCVPQFPQPCNGLNLSCEVAARNRQDNAGGSVSWTERAGQM